MSLLDFTQQLWKVRSYHSAIANETVYIKQLSASEKMRIAGHYLKDDLGEAFRQTVLAGLVDEHGKRLLDEAGFAKLDSQAPDLLQEVFSKIQEFNEDTEKKQR